jgi:hypothetical protein
MAGFNARQAVSALSYDFTGIEVADDDAADLLAAAKGTTPEPSQKQVRHLQAVQRDLLGLPPDTTPVEANKVMAAMSEDELDDLDEQVTDMIAEVTNGKPSREELEALPFRVRQAYHGWLLGELANPSGGTSTGTRRSLAPVKNA